MLMSENMERPPSAGAQSVSISPILSSREISHGKTLATAAAIE